MGLPPFKPIGALLNSSVPIQDGGIMWRLENGGWAFQYPEMIANVDTQGRTTIAWAQQGPDQTAVSVDMDDEGISYHFGDTVVHRDIRGELVYHQPSGTMHQLKDEVIYHWCNPNIIVYQTPEGMVYYDNQGMTFRGAHDLAHYAYNGEVTYQGVGGITRQFPDGGADLWTDSGVLYRHPDGVITYTPMGEKEPQPFTGDPLLADRFPGPPLSAEQILTMIKQALAAMEPPPTPITGFSAPAFSSGPAPAPALSQPAMVPAVPMVPQQPMVAQPIAGQPLAAQAAAAAAAGYAPPPGLVVTVAQRSAAHSAGGGR